jgi:hypothetical protein
LLVADTSASAEMSAAFFSPNLKFLKPYERSLLCNLSLSTGIHETARFDSAGEPYDISLLLQIA